MEMWRGRGEGLKGREEKKQERGEWATRVLGEAERWRKEDRDGERMRDAERERCKNRMETGRLNTHVREMQLYLYGKTDGQKKRKRVRETWLMQGTPRALLSLLPSAALMPGSCLYVPSNPSPIICSIFSDTLGSVQRTTRVWPAWSCFLGKKKLDMDWTHVTPSTKMKNKSPLLTIFVMAHWIVS